MSSKTIAKPSSRWAHLKLIAAGLQVGEGGESEVTQGDECQTTHEQVPRLQLPDDKGGQNGRKNL